MSIETETGGAFRAAARVILLDEHDTVLHIGGNQGPDGATRWFIPGGGVEDGEDLTAAAIREVAEETGCAIEPEALTGPVAYSVFAGFVQRRLLVQKNWYFFHRVARFEPHVLSRIEYERRLDFEWMPIEQCGASDGMLEPELLTTLVKRLREGDIPAEPANLGGVQGS